jgi:CHASE3 domain sensor protein
LALLGLALLLQDRVMQTAAWSQRSEEAIAQTESLGKILTAANSAAVQYSEKRDAASLNAYDKAVKQLAPALAKLDALVSETPSQAARARAIRGALDDGVQILRSYIAFYQKGEPERARALLRTARTQRVNAELQNVFGNFVSAQRALAIARFNSVRGEDVSD